MYRFLVVEDIPATLVQLCSLLTDAFPGCLIDRARTVAEAIDHLVRSHKEGVSYDAAILDFRLPLNIGSALEVNTSVCDTIRQQTSEVPVLHITSFKDDPMVVQHVFDAHSSAGAPPFVLISKSDPKWGSTLVEELQRHLHSKRVISGLDELFGSEDAAFSAERRLRKEGHLTQKLRSFTVELEDLWNKPLEERVRERVLKHFDHWSGEFGHRFTLKFPQRPEPQ